MATTMGPGCLLASFRRAAICGSFALAIALAGCAPVIQHPFDLQTIKPDCGRAYDVYTGYWFWERAFQTPHKLDAWRDDKGQLTVLAEYPGGSSLLATAASVAASGMLLAPRAGEGCE